VPVTTAKLASGEVLVYPDERLVPINAMVKEAPGVWRSTRARQAELVHDTQRVRLAKRGKHELGLFETRMAASVDAHLKVAASKFEARRDTPGVLTVKCYASDRIVLQAGFDLRPPQPAKRWRDVRPSLTRGTRVLERHRKTRRTWFIGGRWRFLPQKTIFTRRASRTLKDAGHLIETTGSGQGYFATLTVAGGTREVYDCISAGSGYIVDRLNRWLRYRTHLGYFCYCWELQDRGAPHLHYMFRASKSTTAKAIRRSLQREWRKILLDVSAQAGVDLFAQEAGGTWRHKPSKPHVHCKIIRKSMSGYLAKYITKGLRAQTVENQFYPGRWTGVSSPLLQAVREARFSFKSPFASAPLAVRALSAIVQELAPMCKSIRHYGEFESLGTTLVSLDVPPGSARVIGQRLQALVTTGATVIWAEQAFLDKRSA
jgi:hypothetical protein